MLDLNKSTNSTNVASVVIPHMSTDGVSGSKETEWINTEWSKYWGLFNDQPDLQTAILLKSYWTVGGGYETAPENNLILDRISGWGKDTFFDILFNLDVTRNIGGDAYAHIIKEDNIFINLKPLDPENMKQVVDDKGILIRYEQISKLAGKPNKSYKPEEIFHLTCNRIADQIHGISRIKALAKIIEAYNETFIDNKQVMHNQARPLILWKLKTDDTTLINTFVAKINAARKLGNDMFIPDDTDAIKHEVINIPLSASTFNWRDGLRNDFFRAIQLPQIMPGGAGQSSESESKVVYYAHELIVKKDQLALEKQIEAQLGIKLTLNRAPSMQPNIQQDTSKDGDLTGMQPSDTQAGVGK